MKVKTYGWLLFITCLMAVLGAAIGPLLRLAALVPLDFNYRNVMHAHSHTMVMGWLFNGFILAICHRVFRRVPPGVFWSMLLASALTILQLVLFPEHGYDRTVILLLTLYTLATWYLLYEVWVATAAMSRHRLSRLLIFIAIFFNFLASVSLFGLGPFLTRVFGIGGNYELLIQVYLHFQYNGFFWFAFLALLSHDVALVNKSFNRFACLLMAAGTLLLTGFLFAEDRGTGLFWGAIGGFCQLLAGLILLGINRHDRAGTAVRVIAILAIFKLVLQTGGVITPVAVAVLETRSLMIAWLHYSFLALYTPLIFQFAGPGKVPVKLWAGFGAAAALSLGGLVVPHLPLRIPSQMLLYSNWWNFVTAMGLFLFMTCILVWVVKKKSYE